MKDIKSKYITKCIFSYLDEYVKLNIVKYNKYIQNIINIDIVNYQTFSGRYIKSKNNEENIFQEFKGNNNELIFEGKYLKGKRNGNGKEYYNGNILIFEGEYLKGKRTGKGKEYYYTGKKWNGKGYTPDGEISYELKEGKGLVKEYDYDENFEFEGEYNNGLREGKGKEYYFLNKLKYEGEYSNGKRNGKGIEYRYDNKTKFIGEFRDGKRWNGEGFNSKNIKIYYLENGKGKVKEYYLDNLELECEYLYGQKNGKFKQYNYYGNISSKVNILLI